MKSEKGLNMADALKNDPYKSKDDLKIEKEFKKKYKEKVTNLLVSIPKSNVFYKDETITVEGVELPASKWYIGNYIMVDSDFQKVYSLESDDVPVPLFRLTTRDYNRIVKECKQRQRDLMKLNQKHKKR